jgi:glycosyltransferase involved in cell wall biosynthesis
MSYPNRCKLASRSLALARSNQYFDARMDPRVLYLTFDGVLQPLGFSQVARVVASLTTKGFDYHLLSVERTTDLADVVKTKRVNDVLSNAGARWSTVAVDLSGSVRKSAEALVRMTTAAISIVRRERVRLIHARGYQSAVVAWMVRAAIGTPYLFDARGCWIEERTDWFSRAPVYAAGKLAERQLYQDAVGVVTLTDLHARDVIDGAFGKKEAALVATIPTCADYDAFRIHANRPAKPRTSPIPLPIQERLNEKTVLAIVGSLNRSYAGEATLDLARRACDIDPSAHLLILTQQGRAYRDLLERERFPERRYTLSAAGHEDMPAWMDWIDWGLLLLPDVAAKRGSMPTKLAEFFASGVRPIAHGCNAEMDAWVRRARSGVVLDALDEAAVAKAAEKIASDHRPIDDLARARNVTEPHFSLGAGVERYASLLRRIV